MSDEVTVEAQHKARTALVHYARTIRQRDTLIRRAYEAGLTPAEIARILGISRQRASEIANPKPGGK